MSNTGHLYQYWYKWEPKLRTLLEARRARLFFPAIREKQGSRDPAHTDILTFELESPICILDSPQKGSITRSTKRMHILIDGTFKFAESADHPCMLHASCNVTLFDRTENDDDGMLDLVLTDALHFDVESPDEHGNRKGFHPFFHVQRGISHDDQRVREVFAAATKRDVAEVRVDQSAKDKIGHPYLRIPTPQLDLFSVMTMVVADCFCTTGDTENAAKTKPAQAGDHRITVEHRLPVQPGQNDWPMCIAGENACPPEDVGGPPGYMNFLEAMHNPAHEQHADYWRWWGGPFDATAFSINTANMAIRKLRPLHNFPDARCG